jgi:hypothetical protein
MEPTRKNRISLFAIILAGITIPVALVTLLSLEPVPLLPDLSGLGAVLIQLATVVAAIAVIIGILNLLSIHLRKLTNLSSISTLYSGVTVLTFIIVLGLHFLEARGALKLNFAGAASPGGPIVTLTLMDALQVVIESALSGLLFFSLVYAAFRLMRRRVTVWNVIFIATLVVVLVGYVQPAGTILYALRDWLLRIPVGAGTRGLLIGIAIGTIVVGVRVLVGQDRLFRE